MYFKPNTVYFWQINKTKYLTLLLQGIIHQNYFLRKFPMPQWSSQSVAPKLPGLQLPDLKLVSLLHYSLRHILSSLACVLLVEHYATVDVRNTALKQQNVAVLELSSFPESHICKSKALARGRTHHLSNTFLLWLCELWPITRTIRWTSMSDV